MKDPMFEMINLAGRGYTCAQIIMLLILRQTGRENPELIRALSGLAYGLGQGSGTCGALTGGACALGLYAGKGKDDEAVNERLPLMLEQLNQWFNEKFATEKGCVTCAEIADLKQASGPNMQACGKIVAETYAQVVEILEMNGVHPHD
jgi:C_GCAxxG_C_C family probable redox protein